MLRKLWRIFRWWLKCLWAGKVVPRKETKLFSRSYMRKAWRGRLREIDRYVNLTDSEKDKRFLLINRRLMVAKRRAYRFE